MKFEGQHQSLIILKMQLEMLNLENLFPLGKGITLITLLKMRASAYEDNYSSLY
jgi:hypothetical protein